MILDGNFQTDREMFWRLFQEKWLALLERQMSRRIKEESFRSQTAFWEEIRLDVSIDETDERLPLGDERICPMERFTKISTLSCLKPSPRFPGATICRTPCSSADCPPSPVESKAWDPFCQTDSKTSRVA